MREGAVRKQGGSFAGKAFWRCAGKLFSLEGAGAAKIGLPKKFDIKKFDKRGMTDGREWGMEKRRAGA